jgi:hypothetical protein
MPATDDAAAARPDHQYLLDRRADGVSPSNSLLRFQMGVNRIDADSSTGSGSNNVRVNAICPGPVEGPTKESVIIRRARALGISAEDIRQQYVKPTALGRMVSASDVSDAVLSWFGGRAQCHRPSFLFEVTTMDSDPKLAVWSASALDAFLSSRVFITQSPRLRGTACCRVSFRLPKP